MVVTFSVGKKNNIMKLIELDADRCLLPVQGGSQAYLNMKMNQAIERISPPQSGEP